VSFYFKLQVKRINRYLLDFGFNVILSYALTVVLFIIASLFLFEKIKLAPYYYAFIALLPVYSLSNSKRNQYLKLLLKTKIYKQVRLLENLIISAPFIFFLLYQKEFLVAATVLSTSIILSFYQKVNSIEFAVPTPFYKTPFEYVVGFRKNWPFFVLCFLLSIIGVSVDNFNLAAFALIVTHLICLNFYAGNEPQYYVWIHTFSASKFLQFKMFTAFIHGLIITIPIGVLLLVAYPTLWYIVVAMVLLAIFYTWLTLLGKYAYYPVKVNLIQMLAVAFSIIFPPFLIISLPYFYIKAKQNLTITIL